MNTPLGPVELTGRGFEIIYFNDRYGHKCSLQASSIADYEKPGTSAVWLGVEDYHPQVMAREAGSVGIKTDETIGWVPYPIPKQVSIYTRMHLSRENAQALITHLQSWLDNDTFGMKPQDILSARITDYLGNGGLFNPEAMEHDKVRTLLTDIQDHFKATKD